MGQNTSRSRIDVQMDKETPMRDRDLAMKKELKRRGLGLIADLAKRLEEDDRFQARARSANDYDMMSPRNIHSPSTHRSVATDDTDSLLKGGLQAQDKRQYGSTAPGSRLSPVPLPIGPVSVLDNKGSREMFDKRLLVPAVMNTPTLVTDEAETIGQTATVVTPIIPKDYAQLEPVYSTLPGHNIHKACNACRKSKRRCVHDANGKEQTAKTVEPSSLKERGAHQVEINPQDLRRACDECRSRKQRCMHVKNGNEDLPKATEPVLPRSSARIAHNKDKRGPMITDSAPAVEGCAGIHKTRSSIVKSKASASRRALTRSAKTQSKGNAAKWKDNVPKSRRAQLFYQPKDDIALLQICIKLKEVIAWGDISGFWNMVQDTLQLETGKAYKKVSRHVRLLVRKRRAEQADIEQRGKISVSRVCAECRPLLDAWIAGGNSVHQASPYSSNAPSVNGDTDNASMDEEGRLPLNSNGPALEPQKRSATDAWLDTSCDTLLCKKIKLYEAEPSFESSKSSGSVLGCWSLSGSCTTSDDSEADESEDDGEDGWMR